MVFLIAVKKPVHSQNVSLNLLKKLKYMAGLSAINSCQSIDNIHKDCVKIKSLPQEEYSSYIFFSKISKSSDNSNIKIKSLWLF